MQRSLEEVIFSVIARIALCSSDTDTPMLYISSLCDFKIFSLNYIQTISQGVFYEVKCYPSK